MSQRSQCLDLLMGLNNMRRGPEEEEDDGCQCDKCNGEPEAYENDDIRDGVRITWTGW